MSDLNLIRIQQLEEDCRAKDAKIDYLNEKLGAGGAQLNILSAEIHRLHARLEESYAKQTFKEWKRNQELITELADALSRYHNPLEFGSPLPFMDLDLIKRVREAAKHERDGK